MNIRKSNGLLLGLAVLMIGTAPFVAKAAAADAEAMGVAKSMLDRETDAWNKDGKVDLSLLAPDVDLINARGPHWHGIAVVSKNGQQVLDSQRPRLSYEIISAEHLSPTIILVISKGTASVPGDGSGPRVFSLHQSRLFIKKDGKWLARLVTSTPIVP